jgi:hypothetical protein
MRIKRGELRRSRRTRRAGSIRWHMLGEGGELRSGWLLETSDLGLAFVWRGVEPPRLSTLIEFRRGDDERGAERELAVVRRACRVHDDLSLIGAELVRLRGFPPEASAAVQEPKLAVGPVVPVPIAALAGLAA